MLSCKSLLAGYVYIFIWPGKGTCLADNLLRIENPFEFLEEHLAMYHWMLRCHDSNLLQLLHV